MKIGEAEIWLRNELSSLYEQREAINIAALVLENITGLSKMDRVTKKEEPLIVQQLHHLTEIHHRLMQKEPVQYALGEAHFFGFNLFVNKHVLIPRPETEELVDWILKDVHTDNGEKINLRILDIGTGSGCIPVTLAKYIPQAEVSALDISLEALTLAKENAALNNSEIVFIHDDILNPRP